MKWFNSKFKVKCVLVSIVAFYAIAMCLFQLFDNLKDMASVSTEYAKIMFVVGIFACVGVFLYLVSIAIFADIVSETYGLFKGTILGAGLIFFTISVPISFAVFLDPLFFDDSNWILLVSAFTLFLSNFFDKMVDDYMDKLEEKK